MPSRARRRHVVEASSTRITRRPEVRRQTGAEGRWCLSFWLVSVQTRRRSGVPWKGRGMRRAASGRGARHQRPGVAEPEPALHLVRPAQGGALEPALTSPATPEALAPTGLVPSMSLLETEFPADIVGELAKRGRRRSGVAYGAHKWWARRPPESVRALLIAAALGPDQRQVLLAKLADKRDTTYANARVADPFVGGGTSLVEAQRLGAAVYGVDVDPLAALITEHELTHLDGIEFAAAADSLMKHLSSLSAEYFPPTTEDEVPLHYFYLRRATCLECGHVDLIYKSLVIARDIGRDGGVVRDAEVTAFCPDCRQLHHLGRNRVLLSCCGKRPHLSDGTYRQGKYHCPRCRMEHTHEQLKTARQPRVLLAVEATVQGGRRVLRRPTDAEQTQEQRDAKALEELRPTLTIPDSHLLGSLRRHKPGIYGFTTFASLFSPRQLIVFGSALSWLADQPLSDRVRRAIALGVSNALASNNLLCGYAVDYGRLSQLFSVRDYSLPTMSVELNPLHPKAGRGTLTATLRRVAASKDSTAIHDTRDAAVQAIDATKASWPDTGGFDIVMTDPPYYDYIAYSDLSQFFRIWLAQAGIIDKAMTGQPLYEGLSSRASFSERLGTGLRNVAAHLKPGGIVVFTYHATSREGWKAVIAAIKAAELSVTAAFPLWADGKSPGHAHEGNTEYDIVFCCRSASTHVWRSPTMSDWLGMFDAKSVSAADRGAWTMAIEELTVGGAREP